MADRIDSIRKLGLLFAELRRRRQSSQPVEDEIRIETVEAVLVNNRFQILGVEITSTGTIPLRVGQRVPVIFRRGIPYVIPMWSARRAQFPATLQPPVGQIVEELLIADNGPHLKEVWFRNYDQLRSLKIIEDGLLPGVSAPQEIYWGQRRDSFVLVTQNGRMHIFTMRRDPSKALVPGERPKATFVRTFDVSTLAIPAFCTISFQFTKNSDAPVPSMTGQIAGASRIWEFTFDAIERFHDATEMVRTVTLDIANGNVRALSPIAGGVAGSVATIRSRPLLDNNLDIILVIRADLNSLDARQGTGNPTTGITGTIETVRQASPETDPFIFETIDAVDADVPGFRLASYFSLSEGHLLVVNATQGTIVFSSFASARTFTCQEEISGRLESAAEPVAGGINATPGKSGGALSPVFMDTWNDVSIPNEDFFRFEVHASAIVADTATDTGAAGALGLYGVAAAEAGLHAGVIPAPDPSLLMIAKTTVQAETVFQFTKLSPTLAATPSRLDVTYTRTAVEMVHRYRVTLRTAPLYARNGQARVWLSVLWDAQRPVDVPVAANDDPQLGVFVLVGGVLRTLIPMHVVAFPGQHAEFIAGGGSRVLFKIGNAVWMGDVERALSQQVGSDATAFVTALPAALTNPDFLYTTKEDARYFVNGWDVKTGEITLDQSVEGFPPEDRSLTSVKELRNLPEGFAAVVATNYQTINDLELLRGLGRAKKDPA